MEDGAAQFQLGSQLKGIAQIAVVGQGQLSLHVVHHHRLTVGLIGAAGGSVAHMTHRHGALRKFFQLLPGEHLVHRTQIPMGGKHTVVIDHNAAALLSPVLQGVQAVISHPRKVCRLLGIGTENAAFFVKFCHEYSPFP